MKKLIFIVFVLLCCIGCTTQKSCEAYAQCDEMYINDYNCELPQRNSYGVDRDYYPNVQTVYYYPRYVRIIRPTTPPLPHSESKPERSGKRPGSTTRNSRNR